MNNPTKEKEFIALLAAITIALAAAVITEEAQPRAASVTPATEQQIVSFSKETNKQSNPTGTFAFFFTSDESVFGTGYLPDGSNKTSTDPFEIPFNGDTVFQTSGSTEGVFKIITPTLVDVNTNKTTTLSAISAIGAYGAVRVVAWVDDSRLLVQSCGGDISTWCIYSAVDVRQDSSVAVGSSREGMDSTGIGSLVINTIGGYIFVQRCATGQAQCEAIKLYLDLPSEASYPYGEYTASTTIATSKNMARIDLGEIDNLVSFGERVTVHVGDGFFVFDLSAGEVLEEHNL